MAFVTPQNHFGDQEFPVHRDLAAKAWPAATAAFPHEPGAPIPEVVRHLRPRVRPEG